MPQLHRKHDAGRNFTMKIQASTVTLLTTVWRPSPMPWRRCWITCRIFESVNDMFSNTFSNDLTVQYLAFALRTTFGLTRKSLSEFTVSPKHLGCRHKWCCPWSHTASTTVMFLPYSSSGDDHMRALCDKRSRWMDVLSPNKMSDRQSLWRALPRS